MPTYEYKCNGCGFSFEKFQSITEVPLQKCPKCKKRKLKRLIGPGSGIIFRGSDWPGQEIARGKEKKREVKSK